MARCASRWGRPPTSGRQPRAPQRRGWPPAAPPCTATLCDAPQQKPLRRTAVPRAAPRLHSLLARRGGPTENLGAAPPPPPRGLLPGVVGLCITAHPHSLLDRTRAARHLMFSTSMASASWMLCQHWPSSMEKCTSEAGACTQECYGLCAAHAALHQAAGEGTRGGAPCTCSTRCSAAAAMVM